MAKRFFKILAIVVFVLSLPVFVIATNFRLLMLDQNVYFNIQVSTGVPASSGFPESTLRAADSSLAAYFTNEQASLDTELKKQGLPNDFFNEREIKHLADVRDLIWKVMAVQQTALGYIVLFLVATFLLSPKRFFSRISSPLMWGAGLTLAVLAVLGILSQVDFSGFWLAVHIVSFSNDLWMLNPATDNLLKMAPEAVWLNGAIMMAEYSAFEALGVGVVGVVLHWHQRRQIG